MTSWRANVFILGASPGDCDSFHSWLPVGIGWMLWLVGSLFLTSIFWPAMMPITCGLYMQPSWLSRMALVGTCHCLSGRPDLIHTKAYFKVPLSLTTTSSTFCGAAA